MVDILENWREVKIFKFYFYDYYIGEKSKEFMLINVWEVLFIEGLFVLYEVILLFVDFFFFFM